MTVGICEWHGPPQQGTFEPLLSQSALTQPMRLFPWSNKTLKFDIKFAPKTKSESLKKPTQYIVGWLVLKKKYCSGGTHTSTASPSNPSNLKEIDGYVDKTDCMLEPAGGPAQ